jgi:hypothetical protein
LFKFPKNIIEEGMKELNSMAKDMVMALFITVKVGNMLEIGNLTKCMEKVYFIIQTIRLHMMVSGKTINFQVMAHYLMNKLLIFKLHLIIVIGVMFKIIG